MTDIEIAQAHEMKKIVDVAAKAGIDEKHLELYGNYKAKLDLTEIRKLPRKAKLILVTAISPTPAGEGKTTTSVGLADAPATSSARTSMVAPARALSRPRVRRQGRRCRRRLRPGRPHGGHQPALHRRLPRHRRGQQPAGRHARQPHPAGQRARHRPPQASRGSALST